MYYRLSLLNSLVFSRTLFLLISFFVHFLVYPALDQIPQEYLDNLVGILDPTQISFADAATHITSEKFWKRLSETRWSNLEPKRHGNSWKRLYVEKYLNSLLEAYYPSRENHNFTKLMDEVKAAHPYVHSLNVQQLLSNLDIAKVLGSLPHLASLELKYGTKSIGMDYDKSLFGMQLTGAMSLARLLSRTRTLTKLVLKQNLLGDEAIRMISRGLSANDTLTHLDLSHNRIGDAGARQLAHVLRVHPVLLHLDLSNNVITEEGAAALAEALVDAVSLQSFSLSLNQIGDSGGRAILAAIHQHPSLTSLELSTCALGTESGKALLQVISDNSVITSIDLSCNDIASTQGGTFLAETLRNAEKTSKIINLDLRRNQISESNGQAIQQILFQRKAAARQEIRKAHRVGWDELE